MTKVQTDVARFTAGAEAAKSLRELGMLFDREVKPLGVTVYAIGHLTGDGRPASIYMTTWPRSWMELYAANGFINDDPAVREALESPEPFTWEELKQRRDIVGNRVFAAAAEFGFHGGFVVPMHTGDLRGLVALAAVRLRLPPDVRHAFIEKARCCYRVAQRLFHAPRPVSISLPPREREALALVAQGLEDAQIGAALGVTRSSAHVYVERAKRRLGATTRAQAVAMAVADGLL